MPPLSPCLNHFHLPPPHFVARAAHLLEMLSTPLLTDNCEDNGGENNTNEADEGNADADAERGKYRHQVKALIKRC